MEIRTTDGLRTLLTRYKEAGVTGEWILTIKGCLKEKLAMDEMDYQNTPRNLRKLWRGLK